MFDSAVKPVDDFFGHVNNVWIKNNPIPPEESRWGSFSVLRVEVEKQLKEIFDGLNGAGDAELDANARKVRDFYRTGMDVEKLDRAKREPLAAIMGDIEKIGTIDDLVRSIGRLHRIGVNAWWIPTSEPDAKQSDVVALYLYQSGLGLPDRDYYVNTDEKSNETRKKYSEYAIGMLKNSSRSSDGDAAAFASIFALEAKLAEASMTRVELRDVEKLYNKMSFPELSKVTPRIDWGIYFEALGMSMPAYAIVCQPKFMEAVNRQFETSSLEELKMYLRWHVLNSLADFLSEDIEKQSFDFYGRTFSGATEMKPRWRRVLQVVNTMLDQAVGKLYVERHFSEEARTRVKALVDRLVEAYQARIESLDWMGAETKKKALGKLRLISKKLGYPDTWKDISALEIKSDSYAENYMKAYAFEMGRLMNKVGKPVDRSEWHMPPQMVNAYYDPLTNEIAFPAAILQAPFFDADASDALNFGGIGTVIGHELTHGFDDQGALFDARGNLASWWTADDKQRFDKQTKHLAEQYDRYEPLPGLHVNGNLTLGENIADLGGILIAYDGLTLAMKGKPVSDGSGLTAYQYFFINYAVTERGKTREEALRLQVQVDPHSPSRYRVNGPLSNMAEFYEAFGCKSGDTLWRSPDDRVKIW